MAKGKGAPQQSPGVFSVGPEGDGLVYTPGGVDPKNCIAIDQAIRHLPIVVRTLEQKAREVIAATGSPDDWEIVLSTKGKQRPRCYVVPVSNKGVRDELRDAVLTIASMSMRGK
jgi:hypothetical protein